MSDRPLELDALMAAEGVTPLRKPKRRKPKREPPAPPERAEQLPGRPAAPASSPRPSPDPALIARLGALEDELDRLREAHAALESLHAAADKERRALARQLSEQSPAAPTPTVTTLGAQLAARGLRPEERADALAALLLDAPEQTLTALDTPTALASLLDDALSICCMGCQRSHRLSGAIVTVDATRCEICGGSDTAAAFCGFAQACERAGVSRVVIIGGSPNYRRELRDLAQGTCVRLDLVDGRARPRTRKVKAQARTADMVVAWGATIVDHATTNAFQATGVDIVQVPHRGVGSMLRWLTARLDRQG